MSDLFGRPIPLRVVLHVNLHSGGARFDWDGVAQNPESGDLIAMHAAPGRLRTHLGPELSRMLLWTHAAFELVEGGQAVEES